MLALIAGTLALYGLGQLINFRGIAVASHSTGPLLIYALDILVRRVGAFSSAVAHHASGFSLSDNLRYLMVICLTIVRGLEESGKHRHQRPT